MDGQLHQQAQIGAYTKISTPGGTNSITGFAQRPGAAEAAGAAVNPERFRRKR